MVSVIVTGGLGGIGAAVARTFAADSARIALFDRETDDGTLLSDLRGRGAADALSLAVDVTDDAGVATAIETVMARYGSIDVLVNVAGQMIYKSVAELTGADWRRMLDVNLVGAAMLTGECFRRMRPGGSIVNIASVHARRTTALVAPYAAAKAALVSLTRSAAIEGAAIGIRVNAISPGAIDTPLLHASPTIRSGAEKIDPADLGQPEDIAALARFLASDAARFITGEDIVADGGRMGRL
jgi:NAD(P)-dependent dehydrogenase (short-subunit alcohol dehydrogenase family)